MTFPPKNTFTLDESLVRAMAAYSKAQKEKKRDEFPWRKTDLKCSCGGFLLSKPLAQYAQESLRIAEHVYNRRVITMTLPKAGLRLKIADKGHRALVALTASIGVPLLRGSLGSYRCEQCGRNMGGYEAIGRNMFSIQPLPQGAAPYYDKEG